MKKSIILVAALILVTTSVFAKQSVFTQFNTYMKDAKSLYYKKDFKNALTKFEAAFNLAPDSPEANFYLGRCALELKSYDEAIAAFDRVLMLNPKHTRSQLEIARIHYERKNYELANASLDTVLQTNIPKNVRDNIMKFKQNITSRLQKHFFSSSVSFGIDYNDNANNDIGNIEFLIPAFNIPVSGNAKEADTSAYISTSLGHIYDIGEKGGFSLANNFLAYKKVNSKFEENDAALFSIETIPTYSLDKLRVTLPLKYSKVYLDGSSYNHSVSAFLSSTYLIDKTSTLSASLGIERSYNDQNSDQDSRSKSISISYKKALGEKQPIILSLSSAYSVSEEITDVRTDVSGSSLSYSIELSKEVLKGLNAAIGYTLIDKNYKDIDVLFRTKREDEQDKYSLNLSYIFSKDTIISGSVSYIDNSSNHAPYIYDKTLVNLNVVKRF